jgi:hypothetical protein
MVFRALYRNRLRRLFGQFVSEEAITEILGNTSEWEALRALLPLQTGSRATSRAEAIVEVQRLIEGASAAKEKRGAF